MAFAWYVVLGESRVGGVGGEQAGIGFRTDACPGEGEGHPDAPQ